VLPEREREREREREKDKLDQLPCFMKFQWTASHLLCHLCEGILYLLSVSNDQERKEISPIQGCCSQNSYENLTIVLKVGGAKTFSKATLGKTTVRRIKIGTAHFKKDLF
jgi:hypothetical protein